MKTIDELIEALDGIDVLAVASRASVAHYVSLREAFERAAHGGYLRSPSRVRARAAVFAAVRDAMAAKGSPLSYPDLGRLFDVDHTTVIYGVRNASTRPAIVPEVA